MSGSSESNRESTHYSITNRLEKFAAPTVWHEFSPLAAEFNAVPMGQGFPGWSPPAFVTEAAASACKEEGHTFLINQYARSAGHLPLTKALSAKYSLPLNHPINPVTEVIVTVGASEALCALMLGLVNEGEEIVVLEPAFDIYLAQAEMCGAIVKFVPLRVRETSDKKTQLNNNEEKGEGKAKEWYVDMNELAYAFSSKTRLFLLNTPHNPTGKVFTVPELQEIRKIILNYPRCIVIADEVYEHMVYPPHSHVSIASLPDMYERTVTVSSAGKTFSVTGWKIGWCIGPEHLIRCISCAHSWLSFSTCTPLQQAVADMLIIAEKPYQGHSTYYEWLLADYMHKRDLLMDALIQSGIEPIAPEGGFFIVGDSSRIVLPEPYSSDSSATRDYNVCRWLTKEIRVGVIPPSAFYGDENKHLAANYVRFAFCKSNETLLEGKKRLMKVREFLK